MNKTILKNSFWLISAQIFTKGVAFFYTIFLARNLTVGDFGQFVVALSYFSLLSSVSDFGINRYLSREIVLNKTSTSSLFFNTIILRTGTLVLIFLLFAASLLLLDPDKYRVQLSLLATLAVFPHAISLTLDSIYIAMQKLNWSAIGVVILSAFTTTSGILFITLGKGSYGAVLAIICGYIIYTAAMVAIAGKQGIRIKDSFNFRIMKDVFIGN